jgi:hypothetical protein
MAAPAPSFKEITCVVPLGEGAALAEKLAQQASVTSATVGGGRGFSERGDVIREVDIVIIVIAADRAAEVFAFVYQECGFSDRRGRIMYQTDLLRSNSCDLLPCEPSRVEDRPDP